MIVEISEAVMVLDTPDKSINVQTFLDKSVCHGETIRFFNYDVFKTITASEISTIMGKLFRSFLGQIGRFWSFMPISE
jgi:hypothetical protein